MTTPDHEPGTAATGGRRYLRNNPAFVLKVLAHPPRLAQTPLGPSVAGGSEITPGASR